jgi:abortive infection bacteriophage resistance protein
VINLCSQSTNGSILKNLCQAKQDKHMNKKIMTIPLVQHLWLANNQVRIDQVLLLSIKYLWKQLDHKNKVFKNESMKDMK